MSDTAIKIENISKLYQLGTVSTQTMYGDLHRWWARMRGKEDPFQKIGTTNTLNSKDGEFVWALKDINLEIKQGDVVGIIGKNGAGKSTLLKILSRVTAPTTGQIKAYGRIASLLEVGTGFHPELTGRENIFLNGAIMGMTKTEIRSKFDEIVDFSGVEKYIDTPVKRYSSGMYVRLAFAVAAHLEPEILIVDEVLAVGDAEFQKKALGKMQDVSKGQGRTVLFVSHNMPSISQLCSKVVLLGSGGVKSIGNTEAIIQEYMDLCNQEINISEKFGINDSSTRRGNGEVRFSNLKLNQIFNSNNDFFTCGDSLEISFNIVRYKQIEEIECAIIIKGGIVKETIAATDKFKIHNINIKHTVRVNNIMLNPGLYDVIIWLGHEFYHYDIVDNIFRLIVKPEPGQKTIRSGYYLLKSEITNESN